MRRLLSVGLLLGALTAAEAGAATQTFKSYEVPAERLEAVRAALRPLLAESARLSELNGRLLIVGTNTDHEIVATLLRDVEARQIQYNVTIIQGASRNQARKLLARPGRLETISVSSEPNAAHITSLRLIAGETATVRTVDARPETRSAWSGQRSSGVTTVKEAIARGFTVKASPQGDRIEVDITPLHAIRDPMNQSNSRSESGKTRVLVAPDKWTALYSTARFDHSAYNQSTTLLRVSVVD